MDHDKCKSLSSHDTHLCKLTADGMHHQKPEEYMGIVRDPQYVCKSCGRVAAEQTRLCDPLRLGAFEE